MTQIEIDILQLRDELNFLKQRVATLENQQVTFPTVTAASPYCYTYLVALSAAKASWPMLENEFDEYCAKHNVTAWTQTDSEQFYREYIYD